MTRRLPFAALLSVFALLAGCASQIAPIGKAPAPSPAEAARADCYLLFDAGSSGTRLHVFERQASGWHEHAGPKVDALADPVRELRGKTVTDLDAATTLVVGALDRMDRDGPVDSKGVPAWPAFDWKSRCQVKAAMVYATAGMRLAEQENRAQSIALWLSLQRKLKAKVGEGVPVVTRTLTGFEEGLYAWLAVREQQHRDDFGIAEVGGASAQVAFPCAKCDPDDAAVRTVQVDGKAVPFFSHSFLGLGIDEAPKALGLPADCAYAVGRSQPGWREEDCAARIALSGARGIRDPYDVERGERGTYRAVPVDKADVSGWFLTGAFSHLDHAQVDTCCVRGGECYDAQNACFRSVYLETLVDRLGVPASSPRADTAWVAGAVLCAANDCLRAAKPPVCDWMADGCL